MSAITNTSEQNWLRASVARQLIKGHTSHNNFELLNFAAGGVGGGAIGWIGTAFIFNSNPYTQEIAAVSFSVIGLFSVLYCEISNRNLQQEKLDQLKQYRSWEIVKGEDLSFLLNCSSDAFQNDVLNMINPSQLKSALTGINRNIRYTILSEHLKKLPPVKSTEMERRLLESGILEEILDNLDNNKPYVETYKKCKEVFGKNLKWVLEDYLSMQVKHANVITLYNFSVKKEMSSLELHCKKYYGHNFMEIDLQKSLKKD